MVETAVFRDPTLHPHVKLVYVALTTYASKTRSVWPSRATLARDTGLSVRTVASAIKAGADAGVWKIEHQRDEESNRQTSNLYHLRDMGRGYEPARVQEVHGGTVHDMHGDGAGDAHEQDQRTRPSSIKTSTSSNAVSGRHFAGSTTDRKIFVPRWLPESDDRGAVVQYLVSAAVATMEAAGLEVGDKAKDAMGYTLGHRCDNLTPRQLADRAQKWVREAGTDHPNGWLGTRAERRAS
ncbi:helix-turn-helix domain-containing protein [Pseudonocardia sediminis]|nr:helix-turn-helix domain-containing protein [Pseudonocardia sediminis]